MGNTKQQNNKRGLFDKQKIIEQVPAREWGPYRLDENYKYDSGYKTSGLRQAFMHYISGKDRGRYNIEMTKQILADPPTGTTVNYNPVLDPRYKSYEDALHYMNHVEGLKKYLGINYDSSILERSPYKPTISKDPTAKYYRFSTHSRPNYWYDVIEDMTQHNDYKRQYIDQTLNTFTATKGRDSRGDYVSVYDEWDYSPSVRGGENETAIEKVTGGTPFEIYDRIYLDDFYNLPKESKGNPWITASIVTANKKGGILKSQQGTKLLVPHKDYLGIPYKQDGDYNYFEAHPENMPTNSNEHWTSRNPATGQLLKSEDHPTFNLMINLEKTSGMEPYVGLDGNMYSKERDNSVPYPFRPKTETDFSGIKTTDNRPYDVEAISYINKKLQGLPDKQRAIILGNIIEESGGNPFAKSKNGTYQGLLQWGEDRYRIPKDVTDKYQLIDQQLEYLMETMHNLTDRKSWTYGGHGSKYKKAKDAYNQFNTDDLWNAHRAFSFGYVRPEGKGGSAKNRFAVVQQIYDKWKYKDGGCLYLKKYNYGR